MSLIQLDLNGFHEAIKSETPVFIKVFAEWCNPCKIIKPMIDEIAEKTQGIAFFEVDVDKTPEVPTLLHLTGVPSFFIYKQNNELGKLVGFHNEEEIMEFINRYAFNV